METIIRTEKVEKIYYQGRPEEVRALNQIDLEIPKNRLVLIRGPSGSGKTTLSKPDQHDRSSIRMVEYFFAEKISQNIRMSSSPGFAKRPLV